MRAVSTVMTKNVLTTTVADEVGPIRDRMRDEDIHAVPVLDGEGALVGIVTSTDVIEEWPSDLGVGTVMSERVRSVEPSTSIDEAAALMLDHHIHHLVVTEGGAVAGILSSLDLLREFRAGAPLSAPIEP